MAEPQRTTVQLRYCPWCADDYEHTVLWWRPEWVEFVCSSCASVTTPEDQ